jgi:hypothetical protein
MGPLGSGAPGVRSMGCLTWQCRGTPTGEGEDVLVLLHDIIHLLFSCSGALSGGHGHSLPLSLRVNHQEKKFLVLEMSLLHCFAVTKEMVVGGAISGILYSLLPKVIIKT